MMNKRNSSRKKILVRKSNSMTNLILFSFLSILVAALTAISLTSARPTTNGNPLAQQDLKHQETKYNVPFLLLISSSDVSVAQLPMIDNGSISVVYQLSSLPDDESADANGIVRLVVAAGGVEPRPQIEDAAADGRHSEEPSDNQETAAKTKKVNISKSSVADAREYEQMPSSSSPSSASTSQAEFTSLGKQSEWPQQQQIGTPKSDNNTSNVFISGNSDSGNNQHEQQQQQKPEREEEVKKKVSAGISGEEKEEATRIGEGEGLATEEKRPRRSNRFNDEEDDGDHRQPRNSDHDQASGSVPESVEDVTSARFGRSAADEHERSKQLEEEVDDREAEEAATALDEDGADGYDGGLASGDKIASGGSRTEFSDFDAHMSLGYVFLTDTKGRIHKFRLSGFGGGSGDRLGNENDYTNTIDPLDGTSNNFSPISTAALKKSPRSNSTSSNSSEEPTGDDYDDANKVRQHDDVTHEQSGRHPTASGDAATTNGSGTSTSDSTSDHHTTLLDSQQRSGKPRIIWSRRKHSLASRRSISLGAAATTTMVTSGDDHDDRAAASRRGAYPDATSTGGRMRVVATKTSSPSLSSAVTTDIGDEGKSEQMEGDDGGEKSGSQSRRQTSSIESEAESSDVVGSGTTTHRVRRISHPEARHMKTQIAVDWINNLLFVLDKYQLIVMDFDGNNELVLIDDFNAKNRPIDIKVDPNNDFLFWLQVGKFHNTIYKLDLNMLLAQTVANGHMWPGTKLSRAAAERKETLATKGANRFAGHLRNGGGGGGADATLALTSHHYAHPVITNLPKHARLFTIDHKHSRIYVPLLVAPNGMATQTSSGSDATGPLGNNSAKTRDEAEVFGSSSNEFTSLTHMNSTNAGDSERDCNSTLAGSNQLGEILAYNLDGTDVGPFRSVGEKSHLPTLEDMQDFTLDSDKEYLYWLTNEGKELVEEYKTGQSEASQFYTAQHSLEGKRYMKLLHFSSNQPVNRLARSNFRKLIDTLLSANSINRLTRDESNQLGSMLERQLPSTNMESSRLARNAPFIILGVTALIVVAVYLVYSLIFTQSPNNTTINTSHVAESISGSSITSRGGGCDGATSNGFFGASSTISRWINRPSTSGGSGGNPETPTYNRGTQHAEQSEIGSTSQYNTSNAIDEHYRDRFLDIDTSQLANLNLWPNNIMDMSNKLYVPVEVLQDEELASIRRVSIDQLEEHKAPLGEGHFGMVVQGTIRCTLAERTTLLRKSTRNAMGTPTNLSARLFPGSPNSNSRMPVPPSVSSGHGSSSTSSEFITAHSATCETNTTTNADYLTPKSHCDSSMSDYMMDQNNSSNQVSPRLGSCASDEFNSSTQTEIKRPVPLNMDTKLRVAIKKLKYNASAEEKKDFLHEAKLLASFDHPNIVHLIGICLDRGSTQIVMELMLGGDLIRYMQENAPGCNNSDVGDLTEEDLYDICLDIVNGCCYLEELNYIHRDLAARNCLVSSRKREERVVKLADFGLARDIYTSKYYKKLNDSAMPIKWMAPECLTEQKFTTMSDIWSFGVVMWEVMGYCQRKPYGSVEPFLMQNHLAAGNRLDRPERCGADMFRLMNACWHWEPKKRPTFQECRATLIEIKSNHINNNRNGTRTII